MPDILFFILMTVSGVFVAMQPLINANLAVRIGVIESAFISFLVGTLFLGALVLVLRHGDLRALPEAPWWQFTGGFLGAVLVTAFIVAVPRIGTTAALAAAIAAQLAAGALFDHVGFLGGRHIPLDLWRVAGIMMLFAGAGLVLRY